MFKIFVIYGPTSSGKSEFADLLSDAQNADIINADSMQVYKSIHILNSSPKKLYHPHKKLFLYNYVSLDEHYSVFQYIDDVKKIIRKQKNYCIVGGSGMYISSLIGGVSEIPYIPQNTNDEVEVLLYERGNKSLYNDLLIHDPNISNYTDHTNTQRLKRAYSVMLHTGNSILSYYANQLPSILQDYQLINIYINPDRTLLYQLCDKRFFHMIKNGAIDEIRDLPFSFDQLSRSVKKMLGIKDIYDYLERKISFDDMSLFIQKQTRNYAKRQYTWFNNKIIHDHVLKFTSIEEYYSESRKLIKILTSDT